MPQTEYLPFGVKKPVRMVTFGDGVLKKQASYVAFGFFHPVKPHPVKSPRDSDKEIENEDAVKPRSENHVVVMWDF